MIQEFVDKFMKNRDAVRTTWKYHKPESYQDILMTIIKCALVSDDYGCLAGPDVERITKIDHGHYQGTEVFVIGEMGYQPGKYWATKVSYGSCSGCDTLQSILGYTDNPLTDKQMADLETLALHMIQHMVEI